MLFLKKIRITFAISIDKKPYISNRYWQYWDLGAVFFVLNDSISWLNNVRNRLLDSNAVTFLKLKPTTCSKPHYLPLIYKSC